MATLEQAQEILNRGLQDQLDPSQKARFDEMLRRGMISPESSIGEKIVGGLEVAGSVASGFGGLLAGATDQLLGSTGEFLRGSRTDTPEGLEAFRKIQTESQELQNEFTFEPRTETGKRFAGNISEISQQFSKFLGDLGKPIGKKVFDITGSPTAAAASESIPTIGAEIATAFAGKPLNTIKNASSQAFKDGLQKLKNLPIDKTLKRVAPTVDETFETASSLYKELDDSTLTVKPESISKLVTDLELDAVKSGAAIQLSPKTLKVMQIFKDKVARGDDISIQDVATMKRQAQQVAASPDEARLGKEIVKSIDDFIKSSDNKNLIGPASEVATYGKTRKMADTLWAKANRGKVVQQAFTNAENAGRTVSFEDALKQEFKKIVDQQVKSKRPPATRFSEDDLNMFRKISQGTIPENFFRRIGVFDPISGGKLGTVIGGGGGGLGGVFVDPTLATLPIVGFVSNSLAKKMLRGRANFANQVVRAGPNARKIITAYKKNVPKKQWNDRELSELLLKENIDLSDVGPSKLGKRAAIIANESRRVIDNAFNSITSVPGALVGTQGIQALSENQQRQNQ